jgi:methylglutaconyl-CoA hydratase
VIASHLQAGPEAAVVAKELIRNVLKEDRSKLTDITCSEIAKKRVSTEGQEGMKALLNKTKPKWTQK